MKTKNNAKALYDQIAAGQLLEAFEKYYAEEVVMQEVGEAEPRVGKQANRAYEEKFMGMIEDFHGMGVDSITSDEEKEVAAVESWMDVTFKGGDRKKLKQVAIQQWKGDLIVEEKFYQK